MDGSTLKVESCDNSTCKIRINFSLGDRLKLLLINQSNLQYKINVTNTHKKSVKTFSKCSIFDHKVHNNGRVFCIPLEDIDGIPEDLFDINIFVYKLKPNVDPIYCAKVELDQYQRILRNHVKKQADPSLVTPTSGPQKPRRSTLTVTDLDADHVQSLLQLDLDSDIETLTRRKQYYHNIELKNLTRGESTTFSSTSDQGRRNEYFRIPLDGVQGRSSDDFDIIVTVYDNAIKRIPITSANLEIKKKLLIFRKSDEERAKQHERQREWNERLRRITEETRLKKQREDEERRKKEREERLKKQRAEQLERIEEENKLRKQRDDEEKQKKEREEQLKKQREDLERIKRQQEVAERQRVENEWKARVERYLTKYDKIPYTAYVTVESSNPRNVSICVEFNDDTYKKLVHETNRLSLNRDRLQFKLTATNQNTFSTKSHEFEGRVSLSQFLPFECTLKLSNRYSFRVDVKKYSPDHGVFVTFLSKTVEHKEVLLKSELETLMQKAKLFQQIGFNRQRLPVMSGYRNKPHFYFSNIKQNRSNIMEVYIKDNNGDPGCPINGQINGLFFAVRPEPSTMEIPTESLFGNRRIILPIEKLLEKCPNFYFADFYCHKKIHYLTLVATKQNSYADQFCRNHLLELSLENNPFFYREQQLNFFTGDLKFEYFCCREPRVEILFTENFNLNDPYVEWDTVGTIGRGSSTPGGLPKRRLCETCNLKHTHNRFGNLNSF